MSGSESMEQLRESVLQCNDCALRAGCRQVVFGEGSSKARILLIGEGPGEAEDRLGRPFVGRAGQLLDKILEACGFDRFEHVFIANIVKCRPPKNRVPLPEERASCLMHLNAQIRLLQPEIIVLLGATALQGLIDPLAKITKARGNWLQWNGIWVMPTYHPAALLRNPALKQHVWEDFKQIVAKYRELVDPGHHAPHC